MIDFLRTLIGKKVLLDRPKDAPGAKQSFYELSAKSIDGEIFHFQKLMGRKVLIVNTASECGFTKQYVQLENLKRSFGEKIEILGFPCNDFGHQEPHTNEYIDAYCQEVFEVTFPIFEKIKIKGNEIHPVYRWLTNSELNGWNNKAPCWNFCKYLIDENGELLLFCNPVVGPSDKAILNFVG